MMISSESRLPEVVVNDFRVSKMKEERDVDEPTLRGVGGLFRGGTEGQTL